MNIAVVGLGLIGGSFAKAIKKNTNNLCFGIDIDKSSVDMALSEGAIDAAIAPEELNKCDVTIISLYPKQTVEFIKQNADNFKKGSIIIDTCGIKTYVAEGVKASAGLDDVFFIPVHPMAGREFSGFKYSKDDMFKGADFIMAPYEDTPEDKIKTIEELALSIGFGVIVKTKPEEHDQIIAFTSQLAHVVSNAYVKSPTLSKELGFSAGSFQDLTRVAKLNENMWTDLFMMNKDPLIFEIDTIIENLKAYSDALKNNDSDKLKDILRRGRILKEESINREKHSL